VRSRPFLKGLTALAAAVAFAASADASRAPAPAPPPKPLMSLFPGSPTAVEASSPDSAARGVAALARAAAEHRAGNRRGVVEQLEPIDFASGPRFPEADRAAFLLAQAYLALGSYERFVALAHDVASWAPTFYTEWIAFQLAAAGEGVGIPTGDAGSPLERYIAAVEAEAAGQDADAEWKKLAEADTVTALGRDLAGGAIVRGATKMLERNEDPRALLATVPVGSRYASRARHMAGVVALEHGDPETGRQMLEALLADDPTYGARREVELVLASIALEQGAWESAHDGYARADRDWTAHRDTLERMKAHPDDPALWARWAIELPQAELLLDLGPAEREADRLAAAARDLTVRAPGATPALTAPAREAALPWAVTPPSSADWDSLDGSARRLGESAGELERTRWDHAREREQLDALARYLAIGLGRGRTEADELSRHAAFLATVRSTLDSLDARIRAVRDESLRRILMRSAAVVVRAGNDLLWIRGMRHFHLDGPNRERALPPPAGYAPPDSVTDREEELAHAIEEAARALAADAPGLVDRSYRTAWRPGLIDRVARQDSTVAAALKWTRRLVTVIDSSLAATASSPELERLALRMKRLTKQTDSLELADAALRRKVTLAAIARTLDSMAVEREGIDYGLAVSAYGRSVRLGAARADSGDTDDPASVEWRERAIGHFKGFLARHPGSTQRGEMRFRLADLLLVEARHDFNDAMARYLAAGAGNGGPLPMLSHSDALDLYRAILREDPGFEHLDAVRFNAAMILADQGDTQAEHFFQELVTLHPTSPYCQEAWLRMGDMRFDEQRFPQAIELYAKAAAGTDASITAIALYKTGWAYYNDDKFAQAAEAFARVLDLYGSERRAQIPVDLEGEAESYLVHSLSGAGGAPAFERHFEKSGHKPYEEKTLLALGQNFRRLGLYADAALVDQMFIRRFPLRPDALLAAQRLVDTRRRSDHGVDLDAARLEVAPYFAPGSRWAAVQTSDSLKAAGAEFSRTLWKASAAHHHQLARENDHRDDWRTTLDLYEKILQSFPQDAEAPLTELRAGEAAAALDQRTLALRHYDTAARSGVDSIATQALWQKVAVTDAWYRSTRPAGDPLAIGRDAEAKAVIAAADELLKRYPEHPGAADLTWRQASLAFAHKWYERAAQDFGRMVTVYGRDPRAPQAAGLKADALFRIPDYESAGAAYESALALAKQAGRDSLARRAEQAIPICYYRYADSMRVARPGDHEGHAARFEKVATGWPSYEHANVAQYRAGLAYLAANRARPGVAAMEKLIRDFPKSEYVKDAHLQIAKAWDAAGEKVPAADAYARFAERFRDDESAKDAWLKAADLYAAAGLDSRAEAQRLGYIKAYPDDQETAMEILEPLARRDLAGLGTQRSIATLLPAPVPVAKKLAKGAKAATAAKAVPVVPVAPPSHLAEYLARAEKNPTLASRGLLAEVKFREAEEAYAAYDRVRLTQPLAASIKERQKRLDQTLTLYRRVVDAGVPEWAHASAFRMGEALIAFGRALENSQRPADLSGNDLTAYEDVLIEKAQPFYDRGEQVWTELLRQKGKDVKEDTWIAQTQGALWKRLGTRFYYRPETDFPLVAATPPKKTTDLGAASPAPKTHDTTQARREEDDR